MASALEVAVQALVTLQTTQDPDERAQAGQWVAELVASDEAWAVAFGLLGFEGDGAAELHVHGAILLQRKLQRSFGVLSEENQVQVRGQLFEAAAKPVVRFEKAVLTKLAACVAHVIGQQTPKGRWQDPIGDIVAFFQSAGEAGPNAVVATMLYLHIIAEELYDLKLLNHEKGVLKSELRKRFPDVLKLIGAGVAQQDLGMYCAESLLAFASWLLFLNPELADTHEVLQYVVARLQDPNMYQEAVEAVRAVVESSRAPEYPQTIFFCLDHVNASRPAFAAAVAEGNQEAAQAMAEVVCCFRHSVRDILQVETDQQAAVTQAWLAYLLDVVATPGQWPTEESFSDLAIMAWRDVLDMVADFPEEIVQTYRPMYTPLIGPLLLAYERKCRLPAALDHFSKEERAEYKVKFRAEVESEVLDRAASLMPEASFKLVHGMLEAALAAGDWTMVESALFMFKGVMQMPLYNGHPSEADVVPVLQLLERLPDNIEVQKTAILSLGMVSDWLDINPGYAGNLVAYIFKQASRKELRPVMAVTMRDLFTSHEDSCGAMAPHVDDILAFCMAATSTLSIEYQKPLMQALGAILTCVPSQSAVERLPQLLEGPVGNICSPEAPVEAIVASARVVEALCDTLTPADKALQGTHPVAVVLGAIVPGLAQAFAKAQEEDDVRALCKLIKTMFRNAGGHCLPHLAPVMQAVLGAYSERNRSQVVSVYLALYLVYRKLEQVSELLKQGFQHVTACMRDDSFQVHFVEDPEFAKACHELLRTVLRYTPGLVALDGFEARICETLLFTFHLASTKTIQSGMSVWTTLVLKVGELPSIGAMLQGGLGVKLVDAILAGFAGGVPRTAVRYLCDVLVALRGYDFERLREWLFACLSRDGFPHASVDDALKTALMQTVLDKKKRSMAVTSWVMTNFVNHIYGIKGTAYARHT